MTPPKRVISPSRICIVAEELAEILTNLHLSDRSERADFDGDIVGIIWIAVISRPVCTSMTAIGFLDDAKNYSCSLNLKELISQFWYLEVWGMQEFFSLFRGLLTEHCHEIAQKSRHRHVHTP